LISGLALACESICAGTALVSPSRFCCGYVTTAQARSRKGGKATHNLGLFLRSLVKAAQRILEADRESPQGLLVRLPIHGEGADVEYRGRGSAEALVCRGVISLGLDRLLSACLRDGTVP
jgi:hypothetical protein